MRERAAKEPTLLYVANATHDVSVFTYLNGGGFLQVGDLTGFQIPTGLCVDKAGDVWVVDAGARTVNEYAHGGTKVIRELKASGRGSSPQSCSVDFGTGDIAVLNQFAGRYGETGNVRVYAPGSHEGVKYRFTTEPEGLAYDGKGNLFVGVNDTGYYFYGPLVEILKTGGAINVNVIGADLEGEVAMQWINPTLLVGSQSYFGAATAYKLFVSGANATVVATLNLTNTQKLGRFWRRGSRFAVPDGHRDAVDIYNLSDGSLYGTLDDGVTHPTAVAISAIPKK